MTVTFFETRRGDDHRQNALPRTLSEGNKNAREKNSIQLWQNTRYNPSPPFNNPHTYPLFLSGSPPADDFDDHKLPDELEGGAQLAGNSDTSRSPSPFLLSRVLLSKYLVLTIAFVPPLGLATTPMKRGRSRPKGSKNKKSAAPTAASTSEIAPAAGEKRKRGRPPKVCSAELLLDSPRPRPHAPPGPESP